MKKSIPARPHGVGLRGGSLSRNSPLFEGPFGRIFRALPPADFGDTDQQSEDAPYLSQDPLWTPDPKYQNAGNFGITDLVRAALSGDSGATTS
jgi:hypothetical protein